MRVDIIIRRHDKDIFHKLQCYKTFSPAFAGATTSFQDSNHPHRIMTWRRRKSGTRTAASNEFFFVFLRSLASSFSPTSLASSFATPSLSLSSFPSSSSSLSLSLSLFLPAFLFFSFLKMLRFLHLPLSLATTPSSARRRSSSTRRPPTPTTSPAASRSPPASKSAPRGRPFRLRLLFRLLPRGTSSAPCPARRPRPPRSRPRRKSR